MASSLRTTPAPVTAPVATPVHAGRLRATLRGSTLLSRRQVLGGLAAGAAAVPLLAQAAGAAAVKPAADNAAALEGMALEPKPDFTLVAQFATYELDLLYGVDASGKPAPGAERTKRGRFRFMTRTWAKDGVLDDNYLGPVMELPAGGRFRVLVKNALHETGAYAGYGPAGPAPEDWMPVIDQKQGPTVFLHRDQPLGMPFFNTCTPDTPIAAFDIDAENVPKNYNWTNLHLHGLQIQPHLFEPQGTSDPKAGYITVKPGEEKLYVFDLPADQPAGTYWYHPHRHNSVAIQAWGGMAGMLFVRGGYDAELKGYGIEREIPFVVHDPHYEILDYPDGDKPGLAKVGRFLDNQNGLTDYTYLVSGRFQPSYEVKRNEVVCLRHLTSTVENLCAFRIVAAPGTSSTLAKEGVEGENLPFWMIASDGIAFGGAPVKKNLMVTGGGERHDLLLQFTEPGEYLVKTDHLGSMQFFGTGPRDQILARFVVSEEAAAPATPIDKMDFAHGVPKAPPPQGDIRPAEILRRRHFVFDIDGDTCTLPYQQFRINDHVYATDEVAFEIEQGAVEEWVLVNPTGGVHPFHVHVNPYQVKEAYSAQVPDPKLVGADAPVVQSRIDALKAIDSPNQWRDTMIIPPKGYLRVWTRMAAPFVGKTVLHCHFLAHEETAMIQNFLIRPPSKS